MAHEITDEQRAWTRQALSRLGVQHGDWIVMQGALDEKRDAMADAVEAVLAEHGARCQLVCVPAGIQVAVLPKEKMAQAYQWQPKGAHTEALMSDPVPILQADVKVRSPHLRLCRMRPRDGDVVAVVSPRDMAEARQAVAKGVAEALDDCGYRCLVVAVPEEYDLTDLDEDKMYDAGWARIERANA